MENSFSIASLLPLNPLALQSILDDQNALRKVQLEATPGAHGEMIEYDPYLHISFENLPKAGPGFVFGTDERQCDIVLPHLEDISPRHCCLTYDRHGRLLLQDFSDKGTSVTYDGMGGEVKSHFQWILNDETMSRISSIVLCISSIQFQILVTPHDVSDTSHKAEVDNFSRDHSNEGHAGSRLGLSAFDLIVTPHGIQNPEADSIYIQQAVLNTTDHARTRRLWDVNTGECFTEKRLFVSPKRGWQLEVAKIARLTSSQNENIVRIFSFSGDPYPCVLFENFQHGNLWELIIAETLTRGEIISILHQSLDALDVLHENDIVHRQLTPKNLALKRREPIEIKLDFRLDHLAEDQTLAACNAAPQYLAPEIGLLPHNLNYYTKPSDIWALGVLIVDLVRPIPDYFPGGDWYLALLDEIEGQGRRDRLVGLIWEFMIHVQPEKRLNAGDCLGVFSEFFTSDL